MTHQPSDTVTLSQADYAGLQEELNALRVKVSDYRKVLKLQKQRTLEAHRLYQQAHGWSDLEFPDLGDLVGWLVAERTRLLADYQLLEELAPPDLPRSWFVKQCLDAWEREQSGDLQERLRLAVSEIDALRTALRLSVSLSELTDEQAAELERISGTALAELEKPRGLETREAHSA